MLCRALTERSFPLKHVQIWNQKIPDMMEPTSSPCFEVYKSGKHQRTHALGGDKSSWIIGHVLKSLIQLL